MRRLLFVLLAALCALGATASGQAAGAEAVPVKAQPFDLDVHQGELIRLSQPANHIFIADPAIADVQAKSPRLLYLYGKKPGETVVYALDARGNVLLNLRVQVTQDLTALRRAIGQLAPDGDVKVSDVGGSVVLSGDVATASQAEDVNRLAAQVTGNSKLVINRMGVTAPNQVYLRVRVAEMTRQVVKVLGFNWDALKTGSWFTLGLASGLQGATVASGTFPRDVINNNVTTMSAFGSINRHGWDLNTLVNALDQQDLITILAEPNLTALSGQKASFLAGGEFPIIVPQGNNTFAVEFKKYGVSLSFTPTIINGTRINLKVAPEVSQLSSQGAVNINGFTIPGLTTRRAETTVELGSGQSFAIAGLLRNDTDNSVAQFPGLGDLPVLGTLFRSSTFQRNESELVIIVTPYLVRPVSTQMATPLQGFYPPSDVARIFLGADYRRKLAPAASGKPLRLVGPHGFVME